MPILRATRATSTLIEITITIVAYLVIRNIARRDYTINTVDSKRSTYINKYRPAHINANDIIAFASLKIKKIYNSRY